MKGLMVVFQKIHGRDHKKMNTIHQIDSISITILMDNSTDFLLTNSSHAIRPQLIKDEKFILPPPVAEHGFSALIQISEFDQSSSENNNKKFLFDAGISENGVLHNADVFGIDMDRIDGIILSHGHFDHFAGLMNIIKRISSSSSSSSKLPGTNYVNIFAH